MGFDYCGISKAEFLEDEATRLESWLSNGYHGKMGYMANHFDKRLDPTKLVDGAQSVISLIYNYFPKNDLTSNSDHKPKIARYAYGEDYHHILRRRLKELLGELRVEFGEVNGRAFADSAPVMERQWATKSGIGWTGKNTLLLNQEMGSYFFLAEVITDLKMQHDKPIKDHCGTCTKCMDACPTDAFPRPYELDASKCISYLTIELKDNIPNEFKGKMDDWIFGCDICQEVCPWNRFSTPSKEPAFRPLEGLKAQITEGWEEITKEVFTRRFEKSPLMRAGYEGIKKNLRFLSSNKKP